jgi:DNA repair protein RadC
MLIYNKQKQTFRGSMKTWTHPGGKLIELGPSALSDEELLAVLIGSGYKGRTAEDIAKELLDNYYSIAGLMGKKLTDLAKIKGLKDVKVVRIAAAFEIARRVVKTLEKE